MSTTNHTVNYALSQYIGTDVTSYLSNYNSDMYMIDAQMKVNATDAATAKSDATSAVSTATAAASSASAAVSTANAANTAAEAAQTAATAAQTAAGTAQTDAAAALRASASNTIGNLAPAYDATLTYAVGDLVTYVDPDTNQGKLYKCIIAIAVPEEFNINKWDDVTTSEVYSQKDKIVANITADGVMTRKELMDTLGTSLSFNINHEYTLKRYDGTKTSMYKSSEVSANYIRFSLTGQSSSLVQITGYSVYNNGNSSANNAVIDGNGATISSMDSTVEDSGVIFTLIEHLF